MKRAFNAAVFDEAFRQARVTMRAQVVQRKPLAVDAKDRYRRLIDHHLRGFVFAEVPFGAHVMPLNLAHRHSRQIGVASSVCTRDVS